MYQTECIMTKKADFIGYKEYIMCKYLADSDPVCRKVKDCPDYIMTCEL